MRNMNKKIEGTYETTKYWRTIQSYLPQNNQLTHENMFNEYFINIHEISIHIDHYCVEKSKATIILFHGVGGNGRLLSFIAVPLNAQGYEVICPDLPLYGLTKYTGSICYQDWVNYGIDIVNHYTKIDTPLFLFGLSAGGMLAYQVACNCESINGLIVTCILDQRIAKVRRNTAVNPFVGIISKPLLSVIHHPFGNIKLTIKAVGNMKAIVNNEELAEIMMADELSSGAKVTIRFLHGMLNPKINILPENFSKCPILLVHPENDKWTDISLSKLFFDKFKIEKEIVMLEGAGHFPIEENGLKIFESACCSFIDKQTNKTIYTK